jgi:salicylate hydroxylase
VNRPSIAIVGAGIAGLTTAAALTRAGLTVTLFEQAARLEHVGAGIQLAPNASRLLHRLGLRLDSVAVRPEAIELRRWDDGQLLGRTVLGRECEELYGAPYYSVHRADLHRALLELLPGDLLRLGEYCTGVREMPGYAAACLSGMTATASLVVGADGIHSVVRQALSDDDPRYSGQTIYRGLVPARRLSPESAAPKVTIWLGPGQHCVYYPVRGGEEVSFAATVPAADWHTESWSATGEPADLAAAYEGWHDRALEVLNAASSVSRWSLHDRDTLPTWSGRRITLVGDAAHPMLPFLAQGANQAVEDAAALAACLGEVTVDGIPAALGRYEKLRIPRTAQVHQRSRDNAKTLHLDDGDGQRGRDAGMGATHSLAGMAWLYGYDAQRV